MRYLAALLTGLLGFLALQVAAQTDCDGADHTILAGSFYYSPASLTINVGETVAWVNEGGFHDVNGNVSVITGESFDNPEAFSLPSVSGNAMGVCMGIHTFTIPGEYNYDCSIGLHAANGMIGTIIVEAPPTGCNDPLACNYNEMDTSDVDCLYDDGELDLSEGVWVMATAYLNPDFGCAIEPSQGLLVQMTSDASEPLTIVDSAELTDYINDMVDQGLIDATDALILNSAFNNADFSFCGGHLSGVAGINTIEADWDGSTWTLPLLGFTLAPAAEMPSGCPNPSASNFDPCANPDPETCLFANDCNDPLACNYDETATSDADCEYYDGTFDLNSGIWLVAGASLDPALDCDMQPAEGVLVQVNIAQGEPVTIAVDDELEDWVADLVDQGLISQLNATLALSAFNNATFSFCGETVTGDAGLTTITSDWNGQAWSIQELGFNLAPAAEMPAGCPDPTALNFDPCANPDPDSCEYPALPGCNDPLACNYDSTSTGTADCNYFDTELFTLEENDFIGLTDVENCASGYAAAYSFPVPLGQDSTGGPLTFTLFDEVEDFLVYYGYDIAAEDLSTVTMSVCDTVLNYNSLVIGDVDMIWDGTGFPNAFYGSYVVPESSLPTGCPDETACNFDACVHPFIEEGCEYLELGTIDGDTLVTAGGTLTFTATPAEGNGFEWSSDCASIEDDNEVATVTATEDCEVCYTEFNADSCAAEICFNVSVISSVGEQGQQPWQLMPNPAAEALRVVWGGEATVFEVFDLNGRRVHTATVYTGVTTLDLSGLRPGLYLAGPQGTEPKRLAIQR